MDKAESTIALLSRYLELAAERRLEEATTCLAPWTLPVFPGAARFASLRHMTKAAQGRYRRARKRIDLRTPLPHGARVTAVMLSPMMVGGTGCAG